MAELTLNVRITGRVQGVAYRYWTKSRAEALNISGWVKNDESGAVLAHLSGQKSDIEQLLTEMWSGPGAAIVRDVQSDRVTTAQPVHGFEIRRD